jgi:hypothetical protein
MVAASRPSGHIHNPKARETARRRTAYERIDAAYFAGQISESARELAKWQLRVLCGMGTSFDTTQSEQARRFLCPCRRRYLSRRQILRLNEELDVADLIWREQRGNGYRTYITAYVPRPVPCAEEREASVEHAPQVHEPTYAEVRQALDRAVAAGEVERAAMLAYQLAMLLARQANVDQAPPVRPDPLPQPALFFGASDGDIHDTPLVTAASPTFRIKDSDIPDRDVESPVCGQPAGYGGDGHDTHSTGKKHGKDVPVTAAVSRLQAWGVESPAKLRRFAAAPLEQIDHAFLAAQQAGGGVGLGLAMLEHGVWQRESRLVPPPGVNSIRGHQERHYTRLCPWCGVHSVRLTLPGSCCEQCGRLPDVAVTTDTGFAPNRAQLPVPQGEAAVRSNSGKPAQSMPHANDGDNRDAAHAELWHAVTTQLAVSPTEWDTWIAPTRLLSLDAEEAIIGAPNIFVRDEVERRYQQQLAAALSTCCGGPRRVRIVIAHPAVRQINDMHTSLNERTCCWKIQGCPV